MPIFTAVLALVLSFNPAHAKSNKAPNGVPWSKVDKRADTIYTAGRYTSMGSFVLSMYGNLTGNPAISLAGSGVQVGGLGMMTGGAMRQRTAVNARGGRVSGALGYASWASLGASVGMGVGQAFVPMYDEKTGFLTPTGAGLVVGEIATSLAAYFLASAQHNKNAQGRRRMGRRGAGEERRPLVQWALKPVVSDKQQGGAVVGVF
jgi:hypothetical protein